MIRLNDIDKAVIDEKKLGLYGAAIDTYYDYKLKKQVNKESLVIWIGNCCTQLHYETKESRDKDIEALNKLLDVKSIEEKIKENCKNKYKVFFDEYIRKPSIDKIKKETDAQTSIYDFDINEKKESNGK